MDSFQQVLAKHDALQSRIKHSQEFLQAVRTAAKKEKIGCGGDIGVFAAGSLGRFETGRRSDLDIFFFTHRDGRKLSERSLSHLQEIEIFSELIRLNKNLDLPNFSGDGMFLKVHEIDDLINATGDTRDDSENLFTARLLLLLESQPLVNDALYKSAIDRVIENYFRDGKGRKDFRPLFILNDLLRYWRTLCLNYERDRSMLKPWWKKNLNLKFSRKLTVFSAVLGIVSGLASSSSGMHQMAKSIPLERLAKALDAIGDQSLLPRFPQVLDDYETFLAAKSYGDLQEGNAKTMSMLSAKAETFGDFLYDALTSNRLDKRLVRYVSI